LDITLLEFYEISKIEIHFFSLNINKFELVDVSYKTFPELPLITAVQMSVAIPLLICPVCIEDMCCLDGGILANYPLNECISAGASIDEILGIRNKNTISSLNSNFINDKSNMLDYIMVIVNKLLENIKVNEIQSIPYEVLNDNQIISFYNLREAIYSQTLRQQLFDDGIKIACDFLYKLLSNESITKNFLDTDPEHPITS
jgi:predicted acylesterase/phospholipase RssA